MEHGFFNNGEIVLGGHFPVCVISKSREDVDKLLAPYQENNMGTCPKEYLVFVNAESEFEKEEIACEYTSFYDFANDRGYEYDEEQNAYGSWENPNAKWDWYTIGGKFNSLIPLINGGQLNCCQIGDAYLKKSDATQKSMLRYWDEKIAPVGKLDAYIRERYLTCYGDRNNFADKRSHFFTGALVTPDGNWHQIGKNGRVQKETSFSVVNDYYSFFYITLQETDPDYWLTVVDCHM